MGGGVGVVLVLQRVHGIFDAKTVWGTVKVRRFLFRRVRKEIGRLVDVGLVIGPGIGCRGLGYAFAFVFVTVLAVVFSFALLDGFQGELDFAVEGGKVGFELFELVFLFPSFFDYFPEDGDIL